MVIRKVLHPDKGEIEIEVPPPDTLEWPQQHVQVLGRPVPAVIRGGEQLGVVDGTVKWPAAVSRSLTTAFGSRLVEVHAAFSALAKTLDIRAAHGREAYDLYVRFRPSVPAGQAGWGARSSIDLADIWGMVDERGGSAVGGAPVVADPSAVQAAVARLAPVSLAGIAAELGADDSDSGLLSAVEELQLEGLVYMRGGLYHPI